MTALVTLGLRLVRTGGALRLVSVLVGCGLAVALLTTAWALPDALYPTLDPAYPDTRRAPLVGLLMCLTVPLLALVFVVGRLSSQVRDRRLASLRLLGVPRRQAAVVAMVENLVPSAGGAALGVVAAVALCAVLSGALDAPLSADARHATLVATGVIVLSVALSLAPLRRIGAPRAGHAAAAVRRPSLWRLTPLVPCLVAFALVLTRSAVELGDWLTVLFLVGLVCGALAIALGTPLVSFATAGGLVRSGRTSLVLAGRGIQTQAAPIGRRVVALGLTVYVIVGGAGMLAVYEGVTYLKASIHQMEVGPQQITVSGTGESVLPAALVDELTAVDGVRAVIPQYAISTPCDPFSPSPGCPSVFVGTCAELSALMVSTGCRDDEPAWIDTDLRTFPDLTLAPRTAAVDVAGLDEVHHGVALTGTITQDVPATRERWVWPDPNQVFLPTSVVQTWGIAPLSATVVADVGPQVRDHVRAVADEHGFYADATVLYDYESVVTTRATVWTIMAIAVGIALLAYGLATVDRAREVRRPRARLVALGVPAGLLRRVDGAQSLVPLLTTIVLATGLGLVHTAAYAHSADQSFALAPTVVVTLLGLVVLGAVLVSCLTMPLTRSRLRSSDLRDD